MNSIFKPLTAKTDLQALKSSRVWHTPVASVAAKQDKNLETQPLRVSDVRSEYIDRLPPDAIPISSLTGITA